MRYRAFYGKTGKACLVSHVDLILMLQRGFRRAGIVVKNTEGFHPKPDLSYGPALPLGMEGLSEVLEFKSTLLMEESEFLEAVNRVLPRGLAFSRLERLPAGTPSLYASLAGLSYSLDVREAAAAASARSGRGLPVAEGATESGPRLAAEFADFLAGKPEAPEIVIEEKEGRLTLHFPPEVKKGFRPQDITAAVLGMENVVFLLRRDAVEVRRSAPPAV